MIMKVIKNNNLLTEPLSYTLIFTRDILPWSPVVRAASTPEAKDIPSTTPDHLCSMSVIFRPYIIYKVIPK